MNTYLLTWNPSCWDVSAMADELASSGRGSTHWTTVSRKIESGDSDFDPSTEALLAAAGLTTT